MDARKSIKYARMNNLIDLLARQGPLTVDQIMKALKITYPMFKVVRYSFPGRLALEDRQVTIPRPVASEDYKYKLATTYQTGDVLTDGEPNLQAAFTEIVSRQATILEVLEQLVDGTTGSVRKRLRSLRKQVDAVLDTMGVVADDAGSEISEWAQHVISR
jgi:hypothetical protein